MNQISIPLDIPDIEILESQITKNEIILTIKSSLTYTNCRKCGQKIEKNHGYDQEILLQHLPILGKRVYLKIAPVRYQCPWCKDHPTTTQTLSWYSPRSPYTHAYEEHLMKRLINSTLQDVCRKEQVGYQSLEGVLDREIQKEVNWEEFESLPVLGLDEIALKKGHKDFVVIVTCKTEEKLRILAVLPNRKKETVKQFLSTIPMALRESIESVCCDMYDGYINAVEEVLGESVSVVIDRFHVAKKYRESLEDLRKKELKRLKKELDDQEYAHLKGAMWALRKKTEDLKEEEIQTLELLFEYSLLFSKNRFC